MTSMVDAPHANAIFMIQQIHDILRLPGAPTRGRRIPSRLTTFVHRTNTKVRICESQEGEREVTAGRRSGREQGPMALDPAGRAQSAYCILMRLQRSSGVSVRVIFLMMQTCADD
jgi:hypothetical protein